MKFIGYISWGYPTADQSLTLAESYIQAGCRALEIGLPSEDPRDEGPFVADLMKRAYDACPDYQVQLDRLEELHRRYPEVELILLALRETIGRLGFDRLADHCRRVGITQLISPNIWDHPDQVEALARRGVHCSAFAHYGLTQEELNHCRQTGAFVYMQAFPQEGQGAPELETPAQLIRRLRDAGVRREIYCGVGVKTPAHAGILKAAGADGFFVGSGLLAGERTREETQELVRQFIREGT